MRYIISRKDGAYILTPTEEKTEDIEILGIVEFNSEADLQAYSAKINEKFNKPLTTNDLYLIYDDMFGTNSFETAQTDEVTEATE